MSNTKLYSIAERMGFWQSLMNKFRGKKPEGKTAKEREMIAADDSIQSRFSLLSSLMDSAKSNLDYGDLQETYNQLFNYDSNLQGMLEDASSLIEFGEKHKIASNRLFRVKLADVVDDSLIETYKLHIKKFCDHTLNKNYEDVSALVEDLTAAREKGDVSKYISVLRKLKNLANEFSEKLAKLNESVVVRHKMLLNKKREESKDVLKQTLQDMGKELKEGPTPIPDVTLPSEEDRFKSQFQDAARYMFAVRPEGMPIAAYNKTNSLIALANKAYKKYGG